jgi:hypothetical protein
LKSGSGLVEYYTKNRGDTQLPQRLDEEQALLQQVLERLLVNNPNIQYWIHGHFHQSVSTNVGSLKTRCLAIDEIWSPTVYSFKSDSPLQG